MFSSASSITRKLSLTLLIALLGSVQVSVASANTPAPEDGLYDCATGLKRADSDWTGFRIASGNVYNIDCTGEVVLPEGLPSIGNYAFQSAKFTSITIPSSITSIGDYAFYNSAVTSITIPSSVTSIGYSAFYNAEALTSIDIPTSVTSIGENAFYGAKSLTSIIIPEGITTIENNTFTGASSLESVTLPSTVTSIGDSAFSNATSLTDITIPSSVTSIMARAFRGASSLTSITIPASVTSIGSQAFLDASSLTDIIVDPGNLTYTSINGVLLTKAETTLLQYPAGKTATTYTIPSTVKKLYNYSFAGVTALTSVTMPQGLTSIDENVFNGASSLTSVTIPEGVKYIGGSAFEDATSLSSVSIPSTVTSIGDYAFYYTTSLTSISIPSTVTKIGYGAFGSSALTSIVIPQGITKIYEGTFGYTSALTSVTIPDSVTVIDYYAFDAATALESISIPSSVNTIEEGAFYAASSLKDVYFLGNAPENVGADVFYGIAAGAKAHISATATGFGTGATWNGLIIERAIANYAVTYNSGSGSSVASGTFTSGGSIQTAPVSTRMGYKLVGWSTSPTGTVVSFPYTPTVSADITLHAIWEALAVKPSYVSGAKLTGAVKVGKAIAVTKGTWKGTAAIAYTYQWYVCKSASTKVLTTGKVAPKCTLIKNAKSTSFKPTAKEKAGYLAVLITGTNKTGKSVIFTSTSGKVS
jgi:hypothetical protein